MQRLILASSSPSRRKILEDAGIRVEAVSSGVDEEALVEGLTDPEVIVKRLAIAKATEVLSRPDYTDCLVLGADQVAWDGAEFFGKPTDAEDHQQRIRSMRGRSHALVTGWTLLGREVEVVRVCVTRMHVRADLTDAEIGAYVAGEEGRYCAGGYAAEGHGAFLFDNVDGDWFNVLGLPLFDVIGVLREHGWGYGRSDAG